MWAEWVILVGVLVYLFYRWATSTFGFFKERGIPHSKPVPLFGSMIDMVLRRATMFEVFEKIYQEHDGKYYGMFDQRKPILLIRDPDLIKQITVKDFDHFVNHRPIFSDVDPLFSNSLFAMRDSKWKDMRSTLSPVFTGNKMRQMFQLMNEVASDTVDYLKQLPGMSKDGVEMELKELCTRYTSDMIASVAFGIRVNSLTDKDNKFYRMGKHLTTFTVWTNLKFFLAMYFPLLTRLTRISVFNKEASDYLSGIVLDAMKYRLENNIVRQDMVQMLMEARGMLPSESPKSHSREWTDTEIVAQSFVFFFAGFETVANLMCFTAHELMANPHVQERLYEEIQEVAANLNGEALTYEAIQKMKYLDMVVSEVLRKWPLAGATDRECNKDFVYESDGDRLEIKKGDAVWIPVISIQRDPKYYPNPTEFDPERFNDENKHSISQYTYMPFGVGPRNCIANRFALLESKAFIYYLVRDFKLERGEKSQIPLKLTKNFQVMAEGGFWLKLKQRTTA